MGNVAGSMLVQSAVPCALGLAFSPWKLTLAPLLGVAAILISTVFVYINLRGRRLSATRLLLSGVPYVALLATFLALA